MTDRDWTEGACFLGCIACFAGGVLGIVAHHPGPAIAGLAVAVLALAANLFANAVRDE